MTRIVIVFSTYTLMRKESELRSKVADVTMSASLVSLSFVNLYKNQYYIMRI